MSLLTTSMLGSLQWVGLALYRGAKKLGLLSNPLARVVLTHTYRAYKRYFEDPFYALTLHRPEFFKDGHVLDVGANIGYTATVFGRRIDSRYSVWAFEPSAEHFSQLSVAARGSEGRIRPIRTAIGDCDGVVDLRLNPLHPGDHRIVAVQNRGQERSSIEHVPVTKIDSIAQAYSIAPISFIKVDVQGYEMHVCRGMTATLDANPLATVVVEFAPDILKEYGVGPLELPRFFAARGYSMFRLTRRGQLAPVAIEELSAPLQSGYADLLFTRRTVEDALAR